MKERDLVYKGKRLICLRVLCVAALCCSIYVDASIALLNSEQESGSDEYSVSQQQEPDSKESENPSSQSEGPESITPVESATDNAQNMLEQEKAVLSNTTHSERAKHNVEESLLNTNFLGSSIVIASLLAWIVILLLRARRRNSQSVAMAISKGDVSGEPDKADKSTTKQRDQARYTADDLQHIIEILKPELVSSVLEAANSKEPEENLQLQQERHKCKRVGNQLKEKSKECEELKLKNEHITRQLNEAKVKCSDAEKEKRIQALKNANSSRQFKNLLLKIIHNLSLETPENQFPDLHSLQINSDDVESLESFFDKGLKTQTDLSDQLEAKKNELSKTTDELKHLKQMIAGVYTTLLKEKPAENDEPESLLATVKSEFRVVTMELKSMREETAAIRNNVHTKVGNGLNESFTRCRDDLLTELHQTDLLPTKVKANLTNALQELRTDHELSNSEHLRYWKAALNQAAKYVFHNPFLQSMETLGSRFLHFFYLAASIAEAKGLQISVPVETDATITASSIEYSEFRKPVVYYDFDEIKQEYFKEHIVKQTAVNMLLLRNMRVAPELLVEITDITDWRSLDAFVSKFSDESVSFITKINQIGFIYTDGDREATNASVEKI